MGEQKLKRERILTDLREGGFTEIQKTLPYPIVPQRVAIVSSQGAAGFEDFCNQLENNAYSFHFELALFQSVMQGAGVEADVVAAFKQIESMATEYDVVVILRGGGAESDLFGFDSFAIGEAIACCPIPVLSGIGHEKDWTVPDFVAYKREKTPTAVAASLIESCLEFAQAIEGLAAEAVANAEQAIGQKLDALRSQENKILRSPKNKLGREAERLEYRISSLKQSAQNQLRSKQQNIALMEAKLGLLNPKTILEKGYSITTKAGKTVRQATQLQKGDEVQTMFLDGKVGSVVS
jgi:exodeoxyribonuclease VII large subunit